MHNLPSCYKIYKVEINKNQEKKISIKKNINLSEKIKNSVLLTLNENKGIDIRIISIKEISSIADYIIIATGSSNRHLTSMAEHIEKNLKKIGQKTFSKEGENQSEWVLLDLGDIIVHLFKKEIREFYNLEKMWSKNFKDYEDNDSIVYV